MSTRWFRSFRRASCWGTREVLIAALLASMLLVAFIEIVFAMIEWVEAKSGANFLEMGVSCAEIPSLELKVPVPFVFILENTPPFLDLDLWDWERTVLVPILDI